MSTEKPRRLGRGLEALLATRPSAAASDAAARQALQRIAVSRIHPNPYQPRVEFKPNELAELEASLKTNGLLQPIVVRPQPNGDGFELIERKSTRLNSSHPSISNAVFCLKKKKN